MTYYKHLITRYLLRKGFFKRLTFRLAAYHRILTKDLLSDAAFLLKDKQVNTIFDLGANIGFVTYQLLKLFPQAQIFSFEPNPHVYEKLEKSYRIDSRVNTYMMGVGDRSGELIFYINANSGTSSFYLPTEYHHTHQAKHLLTPMRVPMIRLDDFVNEHSLEHIEVLKLDIEGYELKALQGASQLIARQGIDLIYTEVNIVRSYEGQPLFHELTSYLAEQNYHLFNLGDFCAQETPIKQAVIGNAIYLSENLRAYIEKQYGKENCGW